MTKVFSYNFLYSNLLSYEKRLAIFFYYVDLFHYFNYSMFVCLVCWFFLLRTKGPFEVGASLSEKILQYLPAIVVRLREQLLLSTTFFSISPFTSRPAPWQLILAFPSHGYCQKCLILFHSFVSSFITPISPNLFLPVLLNFCTLSGFSTWLGRLVIEIVTYLLFWISFMHPGNALKVIIIKMSSVYLGPSTSVQDFCK